jgi:hypothetical protein
MERTEKDAKEGRVKVQREREVKDERATTATTT